MGQVSDWAVGARRKGPPKKVLVAGLAAVAAIAYVVIFGMRGATVYSMTIPELKAKGQEIAGQGVRVTGKLDSQSVSFDAEAVVLSFNLVGDGETLPVEYKGVRPDGMTDDADVIVEGKLRPDGTMEASSLLFKCPSKYEAAPTPASVESPRSEE